MKHIETPPVTGTNKLKLRFTTSEKIFGGFNSYGIETKKLQTGLGFAVVTQCGKSWDIEPSIIIFKPSSNIQYLYAKCALSGAKGELIRSDTELFDTDTHYLVFMQKGTYNELKF